MLLPPLGVINATQPAEPIKNKLTNRRLVDSYCLPISIQRQMKHDIAKYNTEGKKKHWDIFSKNSEIPRHVYSV